MQPSRQASPMDGVGDSERPAPLDQETLAIREKERQAKDIKVKVTAMADARRHAQSTEQELQDVLQEVGQLRLRVDRAEEELQAATAARNAAERSRQELREACHRARETLRQHEVSLVELRSSRDETELQLAQALADRREHHEALDCSRLSFDAEASAMADELERCRAEADSLERSLKRQEQLLEEVRGQGAQDLDCTQACEAGDSGELQALQRQLDTTSAELEVVRQSITQEDSRLGEAERQCRQADERLISAEAAAARSQTESWQRSAELRVEAEEAEKELIAQVGKVAQLEGQVGENRIQIREMQSHIDDLLSRVQQHSDTLMNTSRAAFGLKGRLVSHELEVTRQAAELELQDVNGQCASLRERHTELKREAAGVEVEAEACARSGEGARLRVRAAEQELADAEARRASEEGQQVLASRRLSQLEAELEEAHRASCDLEEEAARLQGAADAEKTEASQQEQGLEEWLRKLRSELQEQRLQLQEMDSRTAATAAECGECQSALPEKQAQAEALQAAELSAQQMGERLRTAAVVARQDAKCQGGALEALSERLLQLQGELDAATKEAVAAEITQVELCQAWDATTNLRARHRKQVQSDLEEAEGRCTAAALQIDSLRSERAQLAAETTELSSQCKEAEDHLARVRSEAELSEASHLDRLNALKADEKKQKLAEAQLAEAGAEFEEKLKELEATADVAVHEGSELDVTLSAHRSELSHVVAQVEQCDEELAEVCVQQASEAARLSELQNHTTALEQRVVDLSSQLSVAEVVVERACKLRMECDSLAAEQHKVKEECASALASCSAELEGTRSIMERASSGILAEKNAELDRRIEQIDELEREVLSLASKVEDFLVVKAPLQQELNATERALHEAREESAEQLTRLGSLHQEAEHLEERKRQLEQRVAIAEASLMAAEEAAATSQRGLDEQSGELASAAAQVARDREEQSAALQKLQSEIAALERRRDEVAQRALQLSKQSTEAQCHSQSTKHELQEKQQQLQALKSEHQHLQLEQRESERERSSLLGQADRELAQLEELDRSGLLLGLDSMEEQKVELLQGQLAGRREALAKAEAEGRELLGTKGELDTEMEQLRDQHLAIVDKLSQQVEHGNLQFCTIERLQDEVRTFEGEAEVLTLGLHEAEQLSESLQKENRLMRQQLEGLYEGSLQDWAAEVHRVKLAAEVQRHQDELRHWQQVAEDAERELRSDVAAEHRRCEDAEALLQQRLHGLELELPRCEEKLRDSMQQMDQQTVGSVHSVPAALHGFVAPVPLPPPNQSARRRALIIGCNYAKSRAPLQGCSNDAWNLQCLLRQSLYYTDDQVRTLIDGSESCPAPPARQPTRANILAGLQWLTSDTSLVDNLLIYFAGYGTQQPQANHDSAFEAYLVPSDFAKDLPSDFFARRGESASHVPPGRGCYRLVALAELTRALLPLPPACRVTVILDCCHSVVPGLDAANPVPQVFPHVPMEAVDGILPQAVAPRMRLLDLPHLPSAPSPPLSGIPACCCHCYSACQSEQWCVELLIEGCVQGAFTWAFVKSLAAGHLDMSVLRHSKALQCILADLRQKFGWIDQTPVLQLSGSAKFEDLVLVPAKATAS